MSQERLIVQASAVAIDGRTLMIEGPPGCGKSSLALSLIDRGAQLVGDDGVTLQRDHSILIASPAPNITGKFEIRNVGIVEMPTASAPLSLILSLSEDAPRFPDAMQMRDVLGINVPVLPFRAGDAAQALRAEWALQQHGLPISG